MHPIAHHGGAVVRLSRRRFLASTGLLAAAAAAAQVPGVAGLVRAHAQSADDVLAPLLQQAAEPIMQALAQDTIAGLVAWVVPGEDEYSQAQGMTADRGGIAARGDAFMLEALDRFLPVPDTSLQSLARAMIGGMSQIPVPEELLAVPHDLSATLDQALLAMFENDQTLPVSGMIAMMINHAAVRAHPESVAGEFLSPFANLSYDEKFDAWSVLEEQTVEMLEELDANMPEPALASLTGVVRFVAGALVEFAAFGSYSEWGVFDPAANAAAQRPVGWEMSGYLPGRRTAVEGNAELLGYYGGVRRVDGSWDDGTSLLDGHRVRRAEV